MALPLRVQNAFRFGHSLAAEVTPRKPGARAWVRVKPILQGGQTERQIREKWTLARQAGVPYDGTISRFLVRYLELSSWDPETDHNEELDFLLGQRILHDESTEFGDEAALAEWLSTQIADFNLLREPLSVDYYFDGWAVRRYSS